MTDPGRPVGREAGWQIKSGKSALGPSVPDRHAGSMPSSSRRTNAPAIPRPPAWSGAITTPLAGVIRPSLRPAVLAAIKAVHTAIFASVAAAIVLLAWDGMRQQPARRTWIAAAMIAAESAIFASNNQVCPLTPLAEQLGPGRGSVADIFLPGWFSRRIPTVGGGAFAIGVLLNLRARLTHDRSMEVEKR